MYLFLLALCWSASIFAQNQVSFNCEENGSISPVYVKKVYSTPLAVEDFSGVNGTRASVSAWYNYTTALSSFVSQKMNYYTLLFPDSVTSIFEDSGNPGPYNLSRVRNHSVGTVFSPSSEIIRFYGWDTLNRKQPYTLDSFAIEYNYMRFTDDNIVDTLIINIYKPQKLLYYSDNKIPRGATVKYDVDLNKGRDYSQEIVYLLTPKDTVTYNSNGKGMLFFGLSNFNITASSYGNPVAIAWTYKPGSAYSISDSLNGSFNQTVPHSKINHFCYWNFNDNDDYENNEFNNGLFIYSWNNELKYVHNDTYGPLYWRGSSFVGKRCYPVCWYKITYDPNWVSLHNDFNDETISLPYPNPANDLVSFGINKNNSGQMVVQVYNSVGQLVYVSKIETGQDIQQIDIPTKNLNPGMYVVHFNASQSKVVRSFMKQ